MSDVAEMLEERPHRHNELERPRRLAGLLEKVDGHLAHVWGGVVQLGDQQTERPLVCLAGREHQLAEMLGRVEADVLRSA